MEQLESKVPSTGHAALFRTVAYREPEGDRSMIRNAEWKLVHDPMGDLDELYCLESDPYEHCNLALDSAPCGGPEGADGASCTAGANGREPDSVPMTTRRRA